MSTEHIENYFSIEPLVYIAGVLTPTNSVRIQSGFNSMPTATISMPPFPQLYGIGREDRVPVFIFIKDTFAGSENYLLQFEGEVMSFSFTSNSTSREFVINAQCSLAFLRDVRFNFLHSIEDLAKKEMIPQEKNNSIYKLEDGTAFPASMFMKGFAKVDKSNTEQKVKVPYEFLDNAYKILSSPGSFSEFNDSALAEFYSKHSKTLKLDKKKIEVPIFDDPSKWSNGFPVLEGIQSAQALNLLNSRATNSMGKGKSGDSFYGWLNTIVSEMQYEFAFIPNPVFSGDTLGMSMLKPMFYESHPPKCNVIFRSHVESIRTREQVYEVPTRIRTDNVQGAAARVIGDGAHSGPLSKLPRIDYWPAESGPSDDNNQFASELHGCGDTYFPPCEEFTGPYLFETHPPTWMSYIDMDKSSEQETKEYTNRILKYLLQLKVYEQRNLEVSLAYNPFITAGFPAVIYDTHDDGFTFVGHVLSVNHTISKNSAKTQITLGFSRSLAEAVEDPIKNPFSEVDNITRSHGDMNTIYGALLETGAEKFEDLQEDYTDEQNNPKDAYKFNERGIATLKDYMGFMGLSESETYETEFGEELPLVMSGDYVAKRRDDRGPGEIKPPFTSPYSSNESEKYDDDYTTEHGLSGIREILREVFERASQNQIY